MKIKNIHLTFVFVFILISFMGCKSSEPVSTTESGDAGLVEMTSKSNSKEINPDKEIIIFINGIVRYRFTEMEDQWLGKLTQFDSGDANTRKIVKTYSIQPKLGWSDFEDMVEYLKIETLPNQTDIKSRKASLVSQISRAYEFTINDGDSERSYAYYNPEGELAQNWESQNVVTFGTYLVSEMQIIQQ